MAYSGAPKVHGHEAWRFSARLEGSHILPKSRGDAGGFGLPTLRACAPTGLLLRGEGCFPGAEAPGFMPLPLWGGEGCGKWIGRCLKRDGNCFAQHAPAPALMSRAGPKGSIPDWVFKPGTRFGNIVIRCPVYRMVALSASERNRAQPAAIG